MHGFDPRPQHLAHVRGVAQHQSDRAPEMRGKPRKDVEPRDSEPHEIEHQQHRQPAKDVRIPGREEPDRRPDGAAKGPRHCEQRTEDRHADHREKQHPNVEPETLEDAREELDTDLQVEERPLDRGPSGRADHGETEQQGEEDRRRHRDQDRPRILPASIRAPVPFHRTRRRAICGSHVRSIYETLTSGRARPRPRRSRFPPAHRASPPHAERPQRPRPAW